MSQDKPIKVSIPDPEVVPQAERRRFTAKYKLRILEEADRCHHPGELGALLRREGLYSSYPSRWRRREQGQLHALASKKRGRKRGAQDHQAEKIAALRRENQRLEQAETVIEVQKNFHTCLG